jgi:hypothetical protein
MAGKKRTRNGQVKVSDAIQQPSTETSTPNGPTPPCPQPQPSSNSSAPSADPAPEPSATIAKEIPNVAKSNKRPSSKSRRNIQKHDKPQKLSKLPPSTSQSLVPPIHLSYIYIYIYIYTILTTFQTPQSPSGPSYTHKSPRPSPPPAPPKQSTSPRRHPSSPPRSASADSFPKSRSVRNSR